MSTLRAKSISGALAAVLDMNSGMAGIALRAFVDSRKGGCCGMRGRVQALQGSQASRS